MRSYVTDEQNERLEEQAERLGMSKSSFISKSLELALSRSVEENHKDFYRIA